MDPAALPGLDAKVEDYLGVADDASRRGPRSSPPRPPTSRSMGDLDIRRAAESSNRLLSSPVKALQEGGLSEGSKVGSTLLELRRTVEDLDPAEASRHQEAARHDPVRGQGRRLLPQVPERPEPPRRASCTRCATARTSWARTTPRSTWRSSSCGRRWAGSTSTSTSPSGWTPGWPRTSPTSSVTDPERAKALRDDVLFYVRQKHQDLLTQLAVSIQNYLAIDIVIKNNIELIKGVDRASTTTVSALRTAVIVAQALGNQKLVLDQITALNTTTSAMIERTSEMLRDNSVAIQQQAASASIGLPQLQAAFANIYATMDAIDTFKVQALDSMAATIGTLETEVGKSRDYLERVSQQDQRVASRLPRPRPDPRNAALRRRTRETTGTWRLHGRRPASSSDSSDDAPSRSAREVELPRVPTADDLLAALDRVESMVAGGAVPAVVASRVDRVCRTVRDTIPRLSTLGSGSPQAYSVMATATDYLPEAVGGYLRLPREFADSRPVDRGKTSLMVLIDQLDLLGATMDQVYDAVCRADAAALVAHGRFLAEKFGHAAGGGDLALSPDTVIAPDPAASDADVDPATSDPAAPGRLQPPGARDGCAVRPAPGRRPRSATPCRRWSPPRVEAGVAADIARAEGAALAAAVAESATGAAGDWAAATGGGSTRDFFDAAVRGRRWRASPTATLTRLVATGSPSAASYARALTEVASAACDLGEPTMRVVGNASVAAAAQLQATRERRTAGPGREPHAAPLAPHRPPSRSTATAETPETAANPPCVAQSPPAPARPVQELLAELDALIGLADGQAGDPPPGRAAAGREAARRGGPAQPDHHPAPGLHRQPRHRQDHGGAAGGRHLPGPRPAQQGPAGRGRPLRAGRRLPRADGDQDRRGGRSPPPAGCCSSTRPTALAGDQYGSEAVDTLVKEMEDRRDDLVVIVAGYPAPMATFVAANPGLASRFRTTIEFEDYTDDELEQILVAPRGGRRLRAGAGGAWRGSASCWPRPRAGRSFGNGRFARNVLEAAIGRHAWRLRDVEAPTTDQLRQLLRRGPGGRPRRDCCPRRATRRLRPEAPT